MSLDDFKQRSMLMWGTGDYGPTSRRLAPVSASLVEAMEVAPGTRVLDVAAGDGNCAMELARRGATVLACDFSPTMIASGRERTEAAGLDVEWHEADAAALPFDDESFDCVTSVFGLIFAPEQETAASEALRVLVPEGRLAFTAWTTGGFAARLVETMRRYGPPSADTPDPLRWGRPEEVYAIFRAMGHAAEVRRRTITFRYASWPDARASLEAHGMAVLAKRSMPADEYEELFADIQRLHGEFDYGEGEAILLDSEYLEIHVTKR